MTLTTRATFELNRCANIRYKLIELVVDASIWGYGNRIYQTAKDIMTLYALEKTLALSVYHNYDETEVEIIIYKIREYIQGLNYESKVDYFLAKYPSIVAPNAEGPYTYPGDGSGGIITTIIHNYYPTSTIYLKENIIDNTQWHSQELTPLITFNGQTQIAGLNFNISNVDVDTIRLEVQGDDSHYTTVGDGYHIVGNTLHWHSFYDLQVGMQVTIKWRS
jgi:hypothetical protein